MDNESEGSVVTLVDEDVESVVTVKNFVESAEFRRVEDEIVGLFEEVEAEGGFEKITEDVEEDEEDDDSEDYQIGGYLKVIKGSRLSKTKR